VRAASLQQRVREAVNFGVQNEVRAAGLPGAVSGLAVRGAGVPQVQGGLQGLQLCQQLRSNQPI